MLRIEYTRACLAGVEGGLIQQALVLLQVTCFLGGGRGADGQVCTSQQPASISTIQSFSIKHTRQKPTQCTRTAQRPRQCAQHGAARRSATPSSQTRGWWGGASQGLHPPLTRPQLTAVAQGQHRQHCQEQRHLAQEGVLGGGEGGGHRWSPARHRATTPARETQTRTLAILALADAPPPPPPPLHRCRRRRRQQRRGRAPAACTPAARTPAARTPAARTCWSSRPAPVSWSTPSAAK